jgi:hypothetical protein
MNTKQIYNSLLLSKNPSIGYRTMIELLDFPESDPTVIQSKANVLKSADVKKLFSLMHPDGYWLQKHPKKNIFLGEGVEYGAFATTHYILSYLAEMGLTKEHPLIAKAADRYLSLIKPDGDWWNHMSCLNGLNIRTFIRLGYKNDERLQRVIELMLSTNRADKGFLCDMHEKRSKKKKSCFRGTLKMLIAFCELPEYYNHPRVTQLIEYFLSRNAIFDSTKTHWVNSDINRFAFPITWGANTWEVVFALSKMGFGNDERLSAAWRLIESKLDSNGFVTIDWTPAQCPVKFGKRNNPNEWITLYYEIAKKYKSEL